MSSTEQLLAAYIAEHRAGGEADPLAFLEQAEPAERHELAALIDAFLAQAPRQAFDAAAYESSSAADIVEKVERVIGGSAGLWPALLPRLRHQARLRRSELVARLATALGLEDRQEKLADYYNRMEQGTLPAAGVSSRVIDALAGIVGETAGSLREAGRAAGEGFAPAAIAFARSAQGEAAPPAATAAAPVDEWDEVDELFRGGE